MEIVTEDTYHTPKKAKDLILFDVPNVEEWTYKIGSMRLTTKWRSISL
jgi:hypothetical protein